MESFYQSLFSSEKMFSEQFSRWLLPEVPVDGHLVIISDSNHRMWFSDEEAIAEHIPNRDLLEGIIDYINDGCDLVMTQVLDGTVVACEIFTEDIHAGYLFVVLAGYDMKMTNASMDLVELLFSQIRLSCKLLEKNNGLHAAELEYLGRESVASSSAQSRSTMY